MDAKPKLNPKQRQIIAERYQGGETMATLARDFGHQRANDLAGLAW